MDAMKIVVLRDVELGSVDNVLLVGNYDEKFDDVAATVAGKYRTPDEGGFAACESVAFSDFFIERLGEFGYNCCPVAYTWVDVMN